MPDYDVTFRLRAPASADMRRDITMEQIGKVIVPFIFPRLAKGTTIDVIGSTVLRVDNERKKS